MEDGEPLQEEDLDLDLNLDLIPHAHDVWGAIIRREPLDVVRPLVERQRGTQRDDDDGHPDGGDYFRRLLRSAVRGGSPLEVVRYLYGRNPAAIKGADPADSRSLPLHRVGIRTQPETVAFLVDRYPKALAMRNDRGELPLHSALRNGAGRSLIQMLVERLPGSVAERDAYGYEAIHVAAAAAAAAAGPRQLDVMRYLIEVAPMSVRERTTPAWGNAKTQGLLPLHLFLQAERWDPLQEDPRDGEGDANQPEPPATDPDVVRLLLEQWPESVHERAESSLPLHLALFSESPSVEVVRIVLDAHPEALQEKDHDGSTVIHKAVRNGSVPHEVLRLVVDARPELLLEADDAGDLPIHVALRTALPTVESTVELLADSCPRSLRVANAQGHRPVHVAILTDNVEAVRTFAEVSPEGLRETDAQGNTPAHLAASCDYASAELATLVVEAWPESLLATNENGDTPIHVAIDRAFPSSEALEVFLEQSPESLRVANAHGIHPLGVAIARNHLPIVNLIVDQVPDSARQVDPRGNCPLFLAAENEHMDLNVVFLLLKAWPNVVVLGNGGNGGGGNGTRSLKRRRSPSMG
jgi:ankyrin repeat protein